MSVFLCVLCVFFNTDAGIECVRLSVFCMFRVCSSVFCVFCVFPGKQVAGLGESYRSGREIDSRDSWLPGFY